VLYNSHPLIPISLYELVSDTTIQPPILKKQAGRPRTKRIRKGTWKKKQIWASSCLAWGHNKRGCSGQPVLGRRKERARDWLHEVEVAENDKQLLSDSEEEDCSEWSELSSDFDIIEGITEGEDKAIDSELKSQLATFVRLTQSSSESRSLQRCLSEYWSKYRSIHFCKGTASRSIFSQEFHLVPLSLLAHLPREINFHRCFRCGVRPM
jgi:hypothetical protein